jgi:hypothetical protein
MVRSFLFVICIGIWLIPGATQFAHVIDKSDKLTGSRDERPSFSILEIRAARSR